jgi:hypothetical protein
MSLQKEKKPKLAMQGFVPVYLVTILEQVTHQLFIHDIIHYTDDTPSVNIILGEA